MAAQVLWMCQSHLRSTFPSSPLQSRCGLHHWNHRLHLYLQDVQRKLITTHHNDIFLESPEPVQKKRSQRQTKLRGSSQSYQLPIAKLHHLQGVPPEKEWHHRPGESDLRLTSEQCYTKKYSRWIYSYNRSTYETNYLMYQREALLHYLL